MSETSLPVCNGCLSELRSRSGPGDVPVMECLTCGWSFQMFGASLTGVDAHPGTLEVQVFQPHYPETLEVFRAYEVQCDDRGRNGESWLRVMIAPDGDVHLAMQEWESFPDGEPSPFPSLRVRSMAGGGRNLRTRQALLWLARAIEMDAEGSSAARIVEETPPGEAGALALEGRECQIGPQTLRTFDEAYRYGRHVGYAEGYQDGRTGSSPARPCGSQ